MMKSNDLSKFLEMYPKTMEIRGWSNKCKVPGDFERRAKGIHVYIGDGCGVAYNLDKAVVAGDRIRVAYKCPVCGAKCQMNEGVFYCIGGNLDGQKIPVSFIPADEYIQYNAASYRVDHNRIMETRHLYAPEGENPRAYAYSDVLKDVVTPALYIYKDLLPKIKET